MIDLPSFISLTALAICGPIGKSCIKKSTEYENYSQKRFLKLFGLLFLMVFSPLATLSSYYYADNAIVAPVAASAVLVNIVFASFFLEEGKHMGKMTIVGILAFVSGLFLIMLTYRDLVGNDDNFDWGVLSLYFGIWILSLTILTNTINLLHLNPTVQLVGWSIVAGLLSGSDIIASMDKWIYKHGRDDSNETYKGIIAAALYTISCLLSIFVLNNLLLDTANPMHVVATILASVQLFCDVVADCLVFQRYESWTVENYAIAIVGLFLMIIGIIILQSSSEKEKKPELLTEGKIGTLIPHRHLHNNYSKP